MAPNHFQKPETALKRAQELIQVGKEADALETLHDLIKTKKHKTWTATHEEVMKKHMELCVELKKHHMAKEALFQYKIVTQTVSVRSLETVIEHFLKLAEQKTEEARQLSVEKVEEIDDLDQGDISETLLLAVVSGAAAQDRMDRTVLAPWLRFLWDSYRNCLDLLRNNQQVEQLYHKITKQTFLFCAKYQRKTEFRKLCELLRLHLAQVQKYQSLPHTIKLTNSESVTLMQETRLGQLDTAIQMELWQEAYKSAEDVHGLMQISKERKSVKPAGFVNYYDKLALVFWKAGNSLFHAAALLQKYIIYKDMKKQFTPEEAQEQATRVLLATLAIPDGSDAPSDLTRNLDIEDQHSANIRLLSNLLRLPIAPTRAGILKEATRINVPEIANDVSKTLYRLLENNFAPLRISKDVDRLLSTIERPDHQQYIESLKNVVAIKALKQVSMIYDTISWKRIKTIIPFYSDLELERLVVEASKHRLLKAHVDHRAGSVRFGVADATLAGGVDLEDADGFTGDDAQLGVEGIRTHLEVMYNKLRQTVAQLDGESKKVELVARIEHHASQYDRNRPQEIERIMQRKKKLENYKENIERAKTEKTQQAQLEQAKREEAMRADEMKRLEEQNRESEKKKKLAEQEEVQRKIRQEKLRKMQQNAIYQAIIKEKGLENFKDMDPEVVLKEQRERVDKERMETQRRLQQQEKNFDHHVRAVHLEEMQERKKIMSQRMLEAPKIHKQFEEARITKAIEAHEKSVKVWNLWEQVRGAALDWIQEVKTNNAEVFEQKTRDWQTKLNAVRADRLARRAEERKNERKEQHIKKKEDEERRKKEEEEMTRQKQYEESRQKNRENRMDGRRRRPDDDSAASRNQNWRANAPDRETIRQQREENKGYRDSEERPERRERRDYNDGPSRSEPAEQGSWRIGKTVVKEETRETRREDGPPPRRSDDRVSASRPAESKWTSGNVVGQAEKPAPAAPTGKFVPPALRRREAENESNGAAGPKPSPPSAAKAAGAAAPASTGRFIPPSMRKKEGENQPPERQENRPQRPPMNRNSGGGGAGSRSADTDNNWRRK